MEVFKLDPNRTSNLGRKTQTNFFGCSSGVLEVDFLQSFVVLKSWWRMRGGCPLFIVVSEDKSHFELMSLKISSRL